MKKMLAICAVALMCIAGTFLFLSSKMDSTVISHDTMPVNEMLAEVHIFNYVTCPVCNGDRYKDGDVCWRCNGTGKIKICRKHGENCPSL